VKTALVKIFMDMSNNMIVHPLGCLYLAANLQRSGNQDVCVIDARLKGWDSQKVVQELEDFEPDIVGLSAFSGEANVAHDAAAAIKSRFPNVKIIIGGPYGTYSSKVILKDKNIDYAFYGEADKGIVQLVQTLESGETVSGIAGLAYRENGVICQNTQSNIVEDLDTLPDPAYDMIDLENYKKAHVPGIIIKDPKFISLQSSRGCPYRCIFCHNVFGKRFRAISADRLFEQVNTLSMKFSVREFFFLDDSFNIDKKRVMRFCEQIIQTGKKFNFSFPVGLRGDVLDKETLKTLKCAGTYRLAFGIESGVPRMQKLLKKNVDLVKLKEMIKYSDELGIITQGFLMLGFPTETEQELKQTVQYACNSEMHLISASIPNPYPETELHDLAIELGKKVPENMAEYNFLSPKFQLTDLPEKTVNRYLIWINIRFYLNPFRLWRLFWLLPRKKQIFTFLRIFFFKIFIWR